MGCQCHLITHLPAAPFYTLQTPPQAPSSLTLPSHPQDSAPLSTTIQHVSVEIFSPPFAQQLLHNPNVVARPQRCAANERRNVWYAARFSAPGAETHATSPAAPHSNPDSASSTLRSHGLGCARLAETAHFHDLDHTQPLAFRSSAPGDFTCITKRSTDHPHPRAARHKPPSATRAPNLTPYPRSYRTVTTLLIPPLTLKSPSTVILLGLHAATRSSRIVFTTRS